MTDLRQCETHRIGYWHPSGCPMCKSDADQGALASALLDARAERDRVAAINVKHCESVNTLLVDGARLEDRAKAAEAELAQARADAVDIVRSVWGRCEALEDEAADKSAQIEKLTDHEMGFWRGQKTVAKSIRRSTEMPTAEAIAIRRAEGGKA